MWPRHRETTPMSHPPFDRSLAFPPIWGKAKPSDSAQAHPEDSIVSDEELIHRVAKKEVIALRLLLERHSRLVRRIALRILHDDGEAEEVVQDVFFYVFQKAALFDAIKGSARGWIVQLTYHRAFDRRKYLNRRAFYDGTDLASVADTLVGEADLERKIAARLNRTQLEKAFQELPERQRRTLELFYFEGLELREIAQRLNEPFESVRHHYYRGLKKLQKSAVIRKLRDQEK
jgi:RNA polymerase sigma-70 factor (ECF subfamily)